MKKLIYLLVITIILSCNNERVLQLPEIENAEITEVLDVSPVYIFYDETQPDSTLFNRKNLIGTTNWLVNVDKRLTLKQAIPHIQYLQNKRKKESMHKNENAKNYFTCNDTSINNLGFVEFTDLNFLTDETPFSVYGQISQIYDDRIYLYPKIKNEESTHGQRLIVEISQGSGIDLELKRFFLFEFTQNLESFYTKSSKEYLEVGLLLDKKLTFQDYISIKSELAKLENDKIIIHTNEFIY
ncbi:MAG: hypothetical protein Tsb0033_25880 [Winogradskyella sp.]